MEKRGIIQKILSREIFYTFGQIRTSVDDNGKEYTNIRIFSSNLLKIKDQIKGQEENKDTVLGAIKKYQVEDKEKSTEKKEASQEAER